MKDLGRSRSVVRLSRSTTCALANQSVRDVGRGGLDLAPAVGPVRHPGRVRLAIFEMSPVIGQKKRIHRKTNT